MEDKTLCGGHTHKCMGRDLLQQWGTQINIPAIPGTANEEITVDMVDAPGEGIDTGDREQSHTNSLDP